MNRTLVLLFVACLCAQTLSAQHLQRSVIGSTGNSLTVNNVVLRQTIGQPSNTLVFSNQSTLRQGFQQPGLLAFAYVNPQGQKISFSLSPNPVQHFTTLQLSESLPQYTIVLSSLTGQVLDRYTTNDTKFIIDCKHLPDGAYTVSIVVNNVVLGAEKLVKKK